MDGGTIACIDPGNFGFGNITKSITIDCRAGGSGWNFTGIAINAPGKHVRIRNAAIVGGGLLTYAVVIFAAASVELDNVTVTGATDTLIYDRRTGPAKLSIRNSTIIGPDADTPTVYGIYLQPQGGTISVILDKVSIRNAAYGMFVGGGARVMVNRSVIAQNRTANIQTQSGAIAEINDTLLSNSNTGLIVAGGSTVALANSAFNSNNTAISGATLSYGNNRFFANAASDGTAPTPVGSASSENGLR